MRATGLMLSRRFFTAPPFTTLTSPIPWELGFVAPNRSRARAVAPNGRSLHRIETYGVTQYYVSDTEYDLPSWSIRCTPAQERAAWQLLCAGGYQ